MNSTKRVFWAVLAKDAESTLSLYLDCLYRQEYDKKLITLYIRTNDNRDNTEQILREFVSAHGHEYRSVTYDNSPVDSRLKEFDNHEWNTFRFSILNNIRNESLRLAVLDECDFYFVSDVDNFIIPQTLSSLVELNLPIVAPLLINARSEEAKREGLGNGDAYANFHCAIDEIGAYQDSSNYLPILGRDFLGIHQLPLVHCTYLVRKDVLGRVDYNTDPRNFDFRNFSMSATHSGIKQYLDNRVYYGCLTLLNEAQTASGILPRLEWYASKSSSIMFKLFNCGDDETRNINAKNTRTRFAKHFAELSSETVYLDKLSKVKDFLAAKPQFKVVQNIDYPGWRLGAIGLWASWFEAFRVFQNTTSDNLIILEDDLWFTEELFNIIPRAFESLPSNWDFLTLFTSELQWNLYSGVDVDEEGLVTTPYGTHCSAALAFSKSGVSKLLSYMERGISQNSDLFLFTNPSNELNGFALTPRAIRNKISIYTNWKSTIGLPNDGLYDVASFS